MTSSSALRGLTLPNPKVGAAGGALDAWYRYYAGYSADFAKAVVEALPADCSVLDPWNGTGTTTVMAARAGLATRGFDVNPALVVVAKARLLGESVTASIDALASDIKGHATPEPTQDDPLAFWFSGQAVKHLRALQVSAHRLLISPDDTQCAPVNTVDGMSSLAAFFYAALFRTVRNLIASTAGTNPTWWKKPAQDSLLNPTPTQIFQSFAEATAELRSGLHGRLDGRHSATLRVGDSRALPIEASSIGAVVTSPPYCTRIDYAVATRPELAVLRAGDTEFRELRDSMVGTPTITGSGEQLPAWGELATAFLTRVMAHSSKASAGYYLKYFRQYYSSMWDSLIELRRVCQPGAPVVLVVQDSHYKEVHNDTPGILLDMASRAGFEYGARHDFKLARTKAAMNPRARKYRATSAAVESVLLLS